MTKLCRYLEKEICVIWNSSLPLDYHFIYHRKAGHIAGVLLLYKLLINFQLLSFSQKSFLEPSFMVRQIFSHSIFNKVMKDF